MAQSPVLYLGCSDLSLHDKNSVRLSKQQHVQAGSLVDHSTIRSRNIE